MIDKKNNNIEITKAINEASILGIFKNFCDKYGDPENKMKLRNILNNTTNESEALIALFKREFNYDLGSDDTQRMMSLIKAFLNKSSFSEYFSPLKPSC